MTDHDLKQLASRADAMNAARVRELLARLPRWGDLYDLNGIVEGLHCAGQLLEDEGQPSAAIRDLAAVAAAELLKGRAAVVRARALPPSPQVAEMVELDQLITSALRSGLALEEIVEEVDEKQRAALANGLSQHHLRSGHG